MVVTVGIAGLGLIGGSLARRLVQAGVQVSAWNHTDRPYGQARREGIVCMPSLQALAQSRPDVLVLCTPLKAMPDVLGSLSGAVDSQVTTLTDVGSVKGEVRRQVDEAGLGGCYVGAHPMAGNEHSGFASSDPSLFDHALWALTADDRTEYRRLTLLAGVITEQVGNAVIVLDDDTHDRAAALISHMPHAVATALINELAASPERNIAVALAAGSWRDMTRVALTDPARTRAMIEEDAPNVERLVRSVASRLTEFADELRDGECSAIRRFFDEGQPFRDFKAGHDAQVVERKLSVDAARWREDLLESARRGERIIHFNTAHEVLVRFQGAV